MCVLRRRVLHRRHGGPCAAWDREALARFTAGGWYDAPPETDDDHQALQVCMTTWRAAVTNRLELPMAWDV